MSLSRTVVTLALALAASGGLSGCRGAASTAEGQGEKLALPKTPPPATPLGSAAATGASTAAAPPAEADSAAGAVLTGTTAARRTSQVSASGSGLLTALLVREGDYVKEGQVIAHLDRRDARLRLQQAQAAARLARVQLTSAEREVARLERLEKDQAVPAAELDRIRTARDTALAAVDQAEVNLAMARKMEADTDVRAPFAGLVTARLKGEGEWISTMPPAPLILLTEVTPMDLKVDVPAALLPQVKPGDMLTVRFVALDRELTTPITRVVPQIAPQTRAFTVFAELPNEDRSLAPGLFAEVRLGGQTAAAPTAEAPAGESRSARRDAPPAGGHP